MYMKNIVDVLNESLVNEGAYDAITKAVEEWAQRPRNEKWMNEVLDAIVKGLKNGASQRDKANEDELFEKGTKALNSFIEKVTK